MENWLFPNVLLLRLGKSGIADNQELDYILRMRERGIDAVASMHTHWGQFLGDGGERKSGGLLKTTTPPAKLAALAAAGVTAVRIPVGWWAVEEPIELAPWVAFDCQRRGGCAPMSPSHLAISISRHLP